MCARTDERVNRLVGCSVAMILVAVTALPGCLQQEDMSADFLTSFEEPSPSAGKEGAPADHVVMEHHAMPPGAAANAAINGEDPGNMASSGVGDGAAASEGAETKSGASSSGSDQGAAGTAAPVAGSGDNEGEGASSGVVSVGEGENKAGDEPAVGVPEFHPHREMPPGYGSSLPPDPQPEQVPPPVAESVAPGSAGPGEPEKVKPAVLSPFEREFEGQKFITVSGTISYDGDKVTTVDIDCFVADSSTRAGRKLVNKIKVDGPGAYSMRVPADYGELYVTSFMDLENNGPDSSDPQGQYAHNPLKIGDEDIDNVDIVLRRPAGSTQ